MGERITSGRGGGASEGGEGGGASGGKRIASGGGNGGASGASGERKRGEAERALDSKRLEDGWSGACESGL